MNLRDINIITVTYEHARYKFDDYYNCEVLDSFDIYTWESLTIKNNDGVLTDQHGKIYPVKEINNMLSSENNEVKSHIKANGKISLHINVRLGLR